MSRINETRSLLCAFFVFFFDLRCSRSKISRTVMSGRITPRRVTKAGADGWPAGIIVESKTQYGPKGVEARVTLDRQAVIDRYEQNNLPPANIHNDRIEKETPMANRIAVMAVKAMYFLLALVAIVSLGRIVWQITSAEVSQGKEDTEISTAGTMKKED